MWRGGIISSSQTGHLGHGRLSSGGESLFMNFLTAFCEVPISDFVISPVSCFSMLSISALILRMSLSILKWRYTLILQDNNIMFGWPDSFLFMFLLHESSLDKELLLNLLSLLDVLEIQLRDEDILQFHLCLDPLNGVQQLGHPITHHKSEAYSLKNRISNQQTRRPRNNSD